MSRHGLLKFRTANSQRFWAVCQATPLDKCLWDLPNLDACSFDSWQKTFCKKKWSTFARILHLPFAWSMLFNLCFLLLGPPKCWTSILHYPAVETFSDLQYCWVRPSFSINPAAVHSLPHFQTSRWWQRQTWPIVFQTLAQRDATGRRLPEVLRDQGTSLQINECREGGGGVADFRCKQPHQEKEGDGWMGSRKIGH